MKFGSIMRACRERAGFSQEELADRLHLTQGSISKFETGSQKPDMDMVMDWAEATNAKEVFAVYMYGQDALNAICKINQTVGA